MSVEETVIETNSTVIESVEVTTQITSAPITPLPATKLEVDTPEIVKPPVVKTDNDGTPKVSAFSLAGLRQKKELQESQKNMVRQTDDLPREAFNETDMLLQWNKFAKRLSDSGQKILSTYMQMNDPKLVGTTIHLELPNEGSKVDFDSGKHELLGYLRGKLHNHDIVIEVTVNEVTSTKHAFTPIEKFEKLKSINPAVETLRKMFDLDI